MIKETKKRKTTIGKYYYFEWLIPIFDYYLTIKRKEVMFEIISPLVIAIVVTSIYMKMGLISHAVNGLNGLLPNVLAILIGFTISVIAIIISAGEEKISFLMKQETFDRLLENKLISLYQFILITMIYGLLQEIIHLGFVFFVDFMLPIVSVSWFANITLLIHVYLILHILSVLTRTIVQLYTYNFVNNNSVSTKS